MGGFRQYRCRAGMPEACQIGAVLSVSEGFFRILPGVISQSKSLSIFPAVFTADFDFVFEAQPLSTDQFKTGFAEQVLRNAFLKRL